MLTSLTLAKMAEQLILTLTLLDIKYLQIHVMVFQMVFIMSISFNISRAHTMVCVAIYTLYIMQCQCAV